MKQIYNILLISAMSLILFACQGDEEALRENVGYLRMTLEQSKDVNTKAAAYNPKQMRVVVKNAEGMVKFETNDHTTELVGKEIPLAPGEYTIEANSNGYDNDSGENRAYYVGTAKATIIKGETASANVVCSLANVKVTVAFEQSFLDKLGAGTINVQVKSATATAKAVDFNKSVDKQVTYFPLGNLTVSYTVTSADGTTNSMEKQIEEVKAKDHYILNFKNLATGTGNVTVTVDPTIHQYTYDFTVDPNAKSGATLSANPWSRFVYLTASGITLESGDFSSLKFQYRPKNTDSWIDAETSSQSETSIATATVKGLTANTEYEYQLLNGTDVIETNAAFITETEMALPNSGFEDWSEDGKVMNPWPSGGTSFWGTGNPGAAAFIGNLTTSTNESVSGNAAKLESKDAFIKLGAGNIFTGDFALDGTNGILNVGRPFTSRPVSLRFHYKYTSVTINKIGQDVGDLSNLKDRPDSCQVYIALSDKPYELKTKPSERKLFDPNDAGVIAYGQFTSGQSSASYQQLTIPLEYRSVDRIPKYIIVVASASKYGDYFIGGVGSTLWLDEMELIYGDNPQIQE